MRVGRVILVSLLVGGGQMAQSHANPITLTHGQDNRSNVMRAFGPTDPPYAFWRFCDEFPEQCVKRRTVEGRLNTTIEQYETLTEVNLGVNRSIEPVTDLELYGVSDYWTLPRKGKGDCEDYALLKRHLLIQAGWPPSALLVTVVRDEKMEGHAVLTARTGKGDFILDNKTDEIKLWNRTPYRFVMRQSYLDPRAWVALDPAQSAPPAEIAVNRAD
jgi:predicted transglutaminase-like cysteine proteinase